MSKIASFINKFKIYRRILTSFEPWWTLIGAPVVEEFIFRLLPYQLYLSIGQFWFLGFVSSILFAVTHISFGKWFMVYSFTLGLLLWALMDAYGYFAVVIIHGLLNIIHLKLNFKRLKQNG